MVPQRWILDEQRLMRLLHPAATFGIAFAAMLVVRHFFLRLIRHRATGPKSNAALLAEAMRLPSFLWALAAALEIALTFADLTTKQAYWADRWIGASVIVSLTLVAMTLAVRMLTVYGERQGIPFAMAGLSHTLVRVIVAAVGGMTLAANFGQSITPLLTALGVGGLAVALALQDTLANVFAGIYILVERPIVVGDLIRLDNGQEGVVSDIGWRTTRVRTGGNDIIVAPNTKITSGILVNYSLPDRSGTAEVAILVSHEADAEEVRRIALEEALRVAGALPDPAPVCLFDPGVLPTHMQFKLIVRIVNRADQGRVASDLRMNLLGRFRAEGVPLPNPDVVKSAVTGLG